MQLTAFADPAFAPAAHLDRAADEFFALIPTHPSAAEEFAHGLQEIKNVVGEILYGGRWPEQQELPKLPAHKQPGEPKKNGGLTRSEQLVSNDLIEVYRKTASSANPEQHKRLASAIHLCQSGLQGRVLRRDYPDYWMSSPGSLARDAQREQARWG